MKVGPTATKQSVLEELLEQGMVLVALDARADGVEVPAHLGHDPQLRLNLSYRFGLPMNVSEWGVNATLTFAGVPFECRIPWTAVFLLVSHVSGQPYLFPDDIPSELLDSNAGMGAVAGEEGVPGEIRKSAPVSRPKLTLVGPGAETGQSSTENIVMPKDAPEAAEAAEPMPAAQAATNEEPPAEEVSAEVVEEPPVTQRPRSRGHLRLVK